MKLTGVTGCTVKTAFFKTNRSLSCIVQYFSKGGPEL
jgi:hypothetical protein